MRELKPVAYLQLDIHGKEMVHIEKDMNGYETKPLYTAEQLQPRVRMTRAEFDEFKKLLSVGISTIYEAFDVIDSDRGEMDEFEHLYNRLFTNTVNEQAKNQIEFSKLWDSLATCSAEETIEIVPDMKWFVRSKKVVKVVGENNYYAWLFDNDYLDVPEHMISDVIPPLAMIFDTKEEAEEWRNPLTEAVLLPVEVH